MTSNIRGAARGFDLRHLTALAILVLLAFLLMDVVFESWVQILFATRGTDPSGAAVVIDLPAWPKVLKNIAYVVLAALAAWHLGLSRSFSRFATSADIALVGLVGALVAAGLLGGSSPQLTAEAIYVYLRGTIVFFAIRAVDPPWRWIKPLLWLVGGVIVINAVVATVLAFWGPAGLRWLGWVDVSWGSANRAQAFQEHPNHLGHIVGLTLLGLLAWFTTSGKIGLRWWLVFGLLALSLALTQSRESLAGVLLGIAVIGVLHRRHLRSLAAGIAVIVVLTGVVWTSQPGTWAQLLVRLRGVGTAIDVPSGSEHGVVCDPLEQDCTEQGLPKRETRVLYMQQGIRLWLDRPALGYGVGQFGGFVALNHDPHWHLDPRFGPEGFDLHGFKAVGVDSFWLHLLVETGAIGSIAYVSWYALLAVPAVRAARRDRRAGKGGQSTGGPRQQDATVVHFTALWAPAALAFGAFVAGLSPALEDHLFPPLLFGVVGLSWVVAHRGDPAEERAAHGVSSVREATADA